MLTALLFGAARIVGVELNPAIIRAVRDDFAEYAGHVYDQPGVQVVIDDARRFIAGSRDRYDLIQASVIDTWAATTAGAFALSENSLYTRQAFKTYFEHLSNNGILSLSRWYLQDQPAETVSYRGTMNEQTGLFIAVIITNEEHIALVLAFDGSEGEQHQETLEQIAQSISVYPPGE